MSKWWFSSFDFDHRDYAYSSASGSRSWMSKFDTDYWLVKKDIGNAEYQKILNQLQTSANLIGDTERLSVRWSDGEQSNTGADKVLILSPDGLYVDGRVDERKLDALTGRVYMATELYKSVSASTLERLRFLYVNSRVGHAITQTIWQALETAIARKAVMRDWVGFTPYIAAEAQDSSASKEEVQRYIDESATKPTAEAAATGIAWNLLNPSDMVTMPPAYDAVIDAAGEALKEERDDAGRFTASRELAKKICTLLGKKESEEPEEMPELTDGSLFGTESVEAKDGDYSALRSTETSEVGGKIWVAPRAGEFVGDKYELVKMKRDDKGLYKDLVMSLGQAIKSIRNSLLFKNSDANTETYGHRSGDIDDGGLHKLFLSDDRVMARKEVRSQKKIGVLLLIDESGSMRSLEKVARARKVAVALTEALQSISGMTVAVYGHSTKYDESSQDLLTLYEYVRAGVVGDNSSLLNTSARSENLDSWAMMHAANIMIRDMPAHQRRLMFVISDGHPHGTYYGGEPAMDHMRAVVEASDKQNVNIYGIGVANAFDERTAKRMYGEGRAVVLSDVESSANIIARFISQVAKKV